MKNDFAAACLFYSSSARQVQMQGVADTVVLGYVHEQTDQVGYVVFYGEQSQPAKW